jgi:amino acid permease
MNEQSSKSQLKRKIIPLSFLIVISLIFAFKFPVWLVDFEGKIWGGEGLFSYIFGRFIICPTLAVLGVVISIIAYCKDDKKERAKVLIVGGIIYICFIFVVLLAMSLFFYEVLGAPLINQ